MNPSVLIVGAIIATLLGALFHLWKDGGLGRLVLYLFLAWLGFFGGHFLSRAIGFNWFMLGQLRLGGGIILAVLVLLLGHWLSLIDPQGRKNHG